MRSPVYTLRDRHTFYLFSGEQQQAEVLVASVAQQFGNEDPKVAVVGTDDANGNQLATLVGSAWLALAPLLLHLFGSSWRPGQTASSPQSGKSTANSNRPVRSFEAAVR